MTTIDQVVSASESLSLAIETYRATCTPPKHRGMSFALEEAQEDGKEQAKAGVWERFKAFIKRIKDWFLSLFKKRQTELEKLEQQEKAVKEIIDNLKKNDPFKGIMDKFKADLDRNAAANRESFERIIKDGKARRDAIDKKREEEKAAEDAARQLKREEQANLEKEQAARAQEERAKHAAKIKEATTLFNSKRNEIVDAAKASVDEVLRNRFSKDIPSVMKIVMSVNSNGDNLTIGKNILEYLDEAKVRILRIDRILLNLSKGEDAGVADIAGDGSINIEELQAIFNGSDQADAWISNIPKHSHEELLRGYQRYCGYVVNICGTFSTNVLRRIDDTIKNTIEDTEKLSEKEGIDPAVVSSIQKMYTEEIAPISAWVGKIIALYGSSLKQATSIGHLNYGLVEAVSGSVKQILGEETYHYLSWNETVGVVANEVLGVK